MSVPSSSPTGLHEVTFEHPDVVFIRLRGDISMNDVKAFLDAASPATEWPHYWLLDSSRAGHLDAEVRKWAADDVPPPSYRGTIIFGLDFTQRMLATMLITAMRLLQPKRPPLLLFATEAQARAWIRADKRHAFRMTQPLRTASSAP